MNRSCICLTSLLLAGLSPVSSGAACSGHGVELQVLGSGGPELTAKRASSGYLVRRDGRASVLVDAGGGVAERFGEAGATVDDLDLILFTHLHADHSADFPALIKASYFGERKRELPVLGPAGNRAFPATTGFVRGLFDPKRGLYRYLGDYLSGANGAYAIRARDIVVAPKQQKKVFSADGLVVTATPVTHGNAPALAWRIEADGRSLVFSGDTAGQDGTLEVLAAKADLFVAHNAIPEGTTGSVLGLHMPPGVIGRIAGKAQVRELVLSHRMNRSLGHEAETQTAIRRDYGGPLHFAEDLDCYSIGQAGGGG